MMCAGAFAQGTLTFQNATPNLVTITVNGTTSTASKTGAAPGNGIEIALYYQADTGGSAPAAIGANGAVGQWLLGGTTTLIPAPGNFNGGTLALSGTSSSIPTTVWIDIVGWNNGATTIGTALGATGTANYFGSAAVFAQTLGVPQGTPPSTPASIEPGFTGLNLQIIPEPTTIALGGLGAASLLFFRRRK